MTVFLNILHTQDFLSGGSYILFVMQYGRGNTGSRLLVKIKEEYHICQWYISHMFR